MERLKTSTVSIIAMVARKSLMKNLLKKWFFDWAFYVTIADADMEV